MHSFEALFLQHNSKHAAGAILHPTGPLIKVASVSHGIHSHMEMLNFKVRLKDFGCSESYGIVGSMQNWNIETPG